MAAGRDALAPIILDGENAWEYYERSGRPFLRELYRRLSEDDWMRAVTMGEAFKLREPERRGVRMPCRSRDGLDCRAPIRQRWGLK
jgi:alpha-amylase/alpha-mannosidase (GH57 family)